ncbi:cyclase, partial [Campylobacter jejuni]|nr:cyclase [Campylobacter jejuni]MGG33971.1 cyclase [Campylobacter jejuni]
MYCELSYGISLNMRFYKDKQAIFKANTVVLNQFCRETYFHFDSHTGTHIDYPAHCIENGKYGDEYPIDYLFSKNIHMIDIDLKDENIPKVTKELIMNHKMSSKIEILIIKTHFCKLRNDYRYIWQSPIIDSNIPLYLKQNFPHLKAVCFDVISVTSQLDRNEGKKCHLNFLSQEYGHEILIIEDVNLADLQK